MRHRKKINHLGRQASHRQAMLSNMAASLILHKRINTTVAKAKALRVYVEPLITKSKEDSTHSRRVVFSYLKNKYAVSELFREVSQKIADRPGGYTRILKTGFRQGDGAEMCFIELVDYNPNMMKTPGEAQQKRTRRGRSSVKKETADAQPQPKKEQPKAETKPEEAPKDENLNQVSDEQVQDQQQADDQNPEQQTKE
jgi:large subunit ribosomal protein L17